MTRDPFEHMKNNNPVPHGTEPSAPMSMAERIVGARGGGWPAWALTAVTAIAVLVVGLGSVWLLGGDGGDDVAGGETTTTAQTETTVTPTTEGTTTTTSIPTDLDFPTAVYFLVDRTGPGWEGGPFLVPVERMIDEPAELAGTIQALLDGPTEDEWASIPMISTAIPDGATVNRVSVDGGIATVDLSAEFAAGAGSFSEAARIEQLIYTVTRFEGIDGMRLEIDGEPVAVFGGHGIVLDDPMVRTGEEMTLPAILIETPAYWGFQTSNPMVATGTANVFEASVSLALVDADGLIIWEGFTTATCGTGCRGEWDIEIPYDVDEPQMGSLIAWESSALDGSQTNVREHPVWLVPADGTTTTTMAEAETACSGDLVDDGLIEQPDLSPQDAAMREAIFEAATSCDWDTLRSLQIEGFGYSFGVNEDAVTYWQELEAQGEEPIRYLAELLNRPFGIQEGSPGGPDYYVWPSAFVTEWSQVSEKEIDELRPLYGDEDFAGFAEFGAYIGYRVGIIDGSWVFFLQGD